MLVTCHHSTGLRTGVSEEACKSLFKFISKILYRSREFRVVIYRKLLLRQGFIRGPFLSKAS